MTVRVQANQQVFNEAEAISLWSKSCAELLLKRATETPDDIAFRDKHLGIYVGYSWRDYFNIVEEAALGFRELGVEKGDRVAIMGDSCPEWLFADMAIMGLGAVTVGIYPTSSPSEVAYAIKDSGSTVFVAETQEHLDKLLACLDELKDLRRIVVIDTRALFNFKNARVVNFAQLREMGRSRGKNKAGEFRDCISAVRAEDAAAIVYTSGTTGEPKGALLSHRSLIAGAISYINCHPDLLHSEHRSVAHLPLSHVVARVAVATTPLISKLVPFFCEEIDEFGVTIREVAPNFIIMPPRFYEKFAAQLLVAIETSTPFKRWSYKVAEKVGRKVLALRRVGKPVPVTLRAAYFVARHAVFKELLEKIGFGSARRAYTGSAPMPPQIIEVWQLWGVDLRELYGVTECCGISIAQYNDFPEPGDIGVPAKLPGFEFRLSEKGEILLRSPMLFTNYWRRVDATAEVMGADGWYHTGDVAELVNGERIKLVDRLRDIIVTSGGKTLSPQQIEKVMKGSPFISEAIVFGHGRKYVSALLELDYTTVSEWARNYSIPYTSYTSLVTRPEIVELIEAEVNRANQYLSRVEQVKVFRVIPMELDPEQGETTPTRKIKRNLIYSMFTELIEAMYHTSESEVFATHGNKAAVVR